jgi:hypothetical protein
VVEKCLQVVAKAEEAERAASRAGQVAGLLESLQDDPNQRLVQDALARAATIDRALADHEHDEQDEDDDEEAPAARAPEADTAAPGAKSAAAAVVAAKAAPARGLEAANGKNNRRDNNKNTMEQSRPLPPAVAAPWLLPAAAQAAGAEIRERGPALAVPRGLRQRVAHLLGSSAP